MRHLELAPSIYILSICLIVPSDFAAPFEVPSASGGGSMAAAQSTFVANPEALTAIMAMGFTTDQAAKALKATVSLIYLFMHCLSFPSNHINQPNPTKT